MTVGSDEPPRRLRFEILERARAYEGFFDLDVLKLRHERFDGDWTPALKRELWCQRSAVTVLPYDPVHDRIVLIEQFRVGAIDAADGPWLLEAPAGLVEPGEGREEVARRELREECGLEAIRLVPVATYRASPGSTSEIVDAFVAEVVAPEKGGLGGEPGEHEDIRAHVMSADDAFHLLKEGRITAITAVLTLLWLQQHRGRLRTEWRSVAEPEA